MDGYQEFAREWVEAWNSHALDRILSHYEDDVSLVSPRARALLASDDGIVRGKTALREYFAAGLKKVPDLKFTLERVYSGVFSAIIEFRARDGRHGAEFMEFSATGQVRRVVIHYASE